jgi:hypothetical protein
LNKRVVWAIALGLFVIGGVAAGLRVMFPGRFDVARWQGADSPDAFARRREMIGDVNKLIDEHTIDSKNENVWLYDLGDQAGAGGAPGPHSWLELRFGPGDNLVAHRVIQE